MARDQERDGKLSFLPLNVRTRSIVRFLNLFEFHISISRLGRPSSNSGRVRMGGGGRGREDGGTADRAGGSGGSGGGKGGIAGRAILLLNKYFQQIVNTAATSSVSRKAEDISAVCIRPSFLRPSLPASSLPLRLPPPLFLPANSSRGRVHGQCVVLSPPIF